MGLDFYFGANYRRNHVDFPPSGWQAKYMFSFLLYGSKRLRGARRVLDEVDFQITHIGQRDIRSYSVISIEGEIRVIKRITFDKTVFMVYGRKGVRGNEKKTFDFHPYYKNHFKEGREFLLTVVSSLPVDLLGPEDCFNTVILPSQRFGILIEHKGLLRHEIDQFYCAHLVILFTHVPLILHKPIQLQVLAIQSLHKVGIVHRDIKPNNII